MHTTRMMIEVLAVGITFLLGALPLLLLTNGTPTTLSSERAGDLAGWTPLLAIALVALAYQAGWIVNGITYVALERIWERRRLNRVFGWTHEDLEDAESEFRRVYASAVAQDLGYLTAAIDKELSATRLSRTGVVNLTLIGLAVMFAFDGTVVAALPIFALAVASYLYSGYRVCRFFELVKHAAVIARQE